MNISGQIEALLLASDEPVSLQKLRELLSDDLNSSDIRSALTELESHYQDRGIQIVQVAAGWQFRSAPEHAELVQQLWQVKAPKLSRSALETLAIIAYRQPTTRAEIEVLRGFRVSSRIIATLQERGWIKVLGRKEVPGRPHLFGTGKAFLVDFGLNSLRDLPDSAQLMDEDEIQNLVGDNVRQIQQGILYETEQSSENADEQENPPQGESDSEAETETASS